MSLQSNNPIEEILMTTWSQITALLAPIYPGVEWPQCMKSAIIEMGDVSMPLQKVASAKKVPPPKFAEEVAAKINEKLAETKAHSLIKKVDAKNGYLNIFLDKAFVFGAVMKNVLTRSTTYGHTDVKKGKIAYVEHTSANPNAPLHIGNLRNVLIGAHVANLLKAVGYDTRQLFYVNDLGAQIGLTVLGYMRIYHRLRPDRKLDQYIGVIYAIMNTFNEIQKYGCNLLDVEEKVKGGYKKAEQYDVKTNTEKFEEWLDIYADLRDRFYDVFMKLLEEVAHINIFEESGKLNLSYEKNEPKAVKLFRKMVMDAISGIQETLDTYRVRHDRWDFESELGWEGANDRILDLIKNSPYYIPQTQCNDKGVPEGSYLDFNKFIADAGLPTGKKGYQQDYPRLYVLRPDGSTLYSFRDVVYSLKKCIEADLVLNVICSEQNLAQEKVALGVKLCKPDMERKQFHLTYDLVKLTSGRMSGRRARYLLADELYDDLKDVMLQLIMQKNKEDMDPAQIQAVTHEMATCAMKWTMLSTSARTVVNFDINKAVSMEDASGPFVLYNSSRMNTLLAKFSDGVKNGLWKELPEASSVDFSKLGLDEWTLFVNYVLQFPVMIIQSAVPDVPQEPALPEFGLHRTCEFLLNLTHDFSSFYNKTKIMIHSDKVATATKEEFDTMYARVYLVKALKTVLDNGLRLLMIEPLAKV